MHLLCKTTSKWEPWYIFKKNPTNMYRIFLILIDVFTSMVIEVLLTLLHFAVDITRVMNLLYRFSCLWLTSQWFLQITDGVATFSSSIDFDPICSIFHIYCLWICFIQLSVLYILYVHVLQISIYKHFLILCDVKNLYDGIVATWRIFEYKLISIILYVVIDVAWERTVVRVYITVACSRTISWLPQHTLAIIIWIYLISVVLFNVIVMLIWKYVE